MTSGMRILYIAIGCIFSFVVMLCFHTFRLGSVVFYRTWSQGGGNRNIRNGFALYSAGIGEGVSTREGIKKAYEIPRIIHQTWKTQDVPDWAEPAAFSWKDKNPEYEYRIWDDRAARKLIEERYPELLPAFNNHMAPVQRADVFRYAVIHAFGGVYADIDVMCEVPVKDWIDHDLFNVDIVLGWEAISSRKAIEARHFAVEFQLCQWTFAAAPGNWLLRSVLDEIVNYYETGQHKESVSIIRSTGPGMFSMAIHRALKRRYNITFGEPPLTKDALLGSGAEHRVHIGSTMILPVENFGYRMIRMGEKIGPHKLVTHGFKGSWKAAYQKQKKKSMGRKKRGKHLK